MAAPLPLLTPVFGIELRKMGILCGDTGGVEQELLLVRIVELVEVGDVG